MKTLTSIIAALIPTLAVADSLGLNSQPLFYSLVNQNPTYHDAAFKAQEAFFLQTGVTPLADKATNQVATDATNRATTFFNETPLDSKTVFIVGAMTYSALVRKQVTEKFHNPVFTSVTHTITVNQNSASTGVQIPFPF